MSSEIDESLTTESHDRQRSDDLRAHSTVSDQCRDTAETFNEGSDWSETISENSDTGASIRTGDDGSCSSISGVSSQPEPNETNSQIAEPTESRENNTRDSDADDDSEEPYAGFFPFCLRKMVTQYAKEIVCFFALALTTYATLQNGPPKISRAPLPTPLFAKHSVVHEWPSGHLNVIQSKVSMSELSLVLFYAPWCAESQFAKVAYEGVAYKYHKQVFFAAVNCWQPGGECRLQYAKVQAWPVLMAYYPQGVAVQYNGPWLVQPLSRFIEGLMKPYKRLTNKNELEVLQIDSNSVVVGFFSEIELKHSDFFMFVQSAIKWLEKDPYQDVQYAIVTGDSCREFNVFETSTVRLYNWNETLEMNLKDQSSVDNITKWIRDRINFITTWIHPPGRKSATLAPYFKAGPTVILLTPKDYYTCNKDAYHMLKQIALEYYRSKNNTPIINTSGASIQSAREDNLKRYLKLKSTCANISDSKSDDEDTKAFNACTTDEPNITFTNILNNSKFDQLLEDTERYCYVGPKTKGSSKSSTSSSSCGNMYRKEWRARMKMKSDRMAETPKSPLSMLQPERDSRSAVKLLEQLLINQCRALRLSDDAFSSFFFINEETFGQSEFANRMNEFNRTISFILMDSIMYKPFASRLGIDVDSNPKRSSLIIIDNDNDSTYHMKDEISTNSVMSFVKNFISGKAKRKLRSTKKVSSPSTGKQILIKEINSKEFLDYLNLSRRTIVVLFYSAQCALCSLFSQTLLMVAKTLEAIDIDFLRIDSDINDFQWHYTMDTYPTLIIFPRNRTSDSRIFPHSMEVNVSNILGFIIANLSPEERLQAIYESCQFKKTSSSIQNCLFTLRLEISSNISRNLRHWRHYPQRRNEILRKLQILQRLYLKSFQINMVKDFETIQKDMMQLKQLREK